MFLPPADSAELFTTCLAHVQQVGQLKNYNGMRVFHQTFKAHWLLHAAYNARYYHPSLGWCFMGEDYMKYCRRWLCSSTPGVKPHLVHKKLRVKLLSQSTMLYRDSFTWRCNHWAALISLLFWEPRGSSWMFPWYFCSKHLNKCVRIVSDRYHQHVFNRIVTASIVQVMLQHCTCKSL